MALPAFMTRQIAAAHRRMIERMCSDPNYALSLSRRSQHARLGAWLPPVDPRQNVRIVEVGCGPGKYVALLAALGYHVTGVDPFTFPEWKTIADKFPDRVTFRQGHAEDLQLPDNHFDHVVCLGALLYFENPSQALRELHRVSKADARLILRTVNKDNDFTHRTGRRLDPASRNLYDAGEIRNLISSHGFVVNEQFTFGFWPPAYPNFYWYLHEVVMPQFARNLLSWSLPKQRRVNHVLSAQRVALPAAFHSQAA